MYISLYHNIKKIFIAEKKIMYVNSMQLNYNTNYKNCKYIYIFCKNNFLRHDAYT